MTVFSENFIVSSPTIKSKSQWILQKEFIWHSFKGDIIVPEGFETDGVSTPKLLWGWIPPFDAKVTRAALPHDYLYTMLEEGTPHALARTRKEADAMLFYACKDAELSILSCWLIWIGVRLFGRSHVIYKDYKPSDIV